MQRMIHRVAENKLICIPTLSDSMNIDNYQKDVFVSDGKLHAKWLQLELNLNAIITLEIRCGLAAIKDVYPDIKELF